MPCTSRTIAGCAALVFAATSIGCGPGARAQDTQPQPFPGYMNFQGRYLAVLSDADMVASAYLDGVITQALA